MVSAYLFLQCVVMLFEFLSVALLCITFYVKTLKYDPWHWRRKRGGGGGGKGGMCPPTFLIGGGNGMFVPPHF